MTTNDHQPLEVLSFEGFHVVRCSCGSEALPTPGMWFREHWQGSQREAEAAILATMRRQRKAGSQ